VLKDEIKKPYFISLKEFLWKEGVQGPDDSAQNLKVYPARKFPSGLRVPNSHHPNLGLSSRMRRSAEYLFMVELYPSWQGQSRHDWPRPLPRTWSSTRYAEPGAHRPFLRCNRSHNFYFYLLTHRISHILLPDRSLLLGAARCYNATLVKECKPSLSLSILHPPLPPRAYAILSPMTAVTHFFWWARLRFMRKSRPNIQTSSPQSTGA